MIKALTLASIVLVMSSFTYSQTLSDSPNLTRCPTEFYTVPLHQNAKLCQIFDKGPAASLVYYAPHSVNEVISFYTQNALFTAASTVRTRTLLSSSDNGLRVVVSPDGDGSQIDILIVTTNN